MLRTDDLAAVPRHRAVIVFGPAAETRRVVRDLARVGGIGSASVTDDPQAAVPDGTLVLVAGPGWPEARAEAAIDVRPHLARAAFIAAFADAAAALADRADALAGRLVAGPADLERLPPGRPRLIYGAGNGGRLLHGALRSCPGHPVAGFLDSAREGELEGLPIHRADAFLDAAGSDATILIASQNWLEIARRLDGRPVDVWNAYPWVRRLADPRADAFW